MSQRAVVQVSDEELKRIKEAKSKLENFLGDKLSDEQFSDWLNKNTVSLLPGINAFVLRK